MLSCEGAADLVTAGYRLFVPLKWHLMVGVL